MDRESIGMANSFDNWDIGQLYNEIINFYFINIL